VTFQLPHALLTNDDAKALELLKTYYGPVFGAEKYYTGAVFDTWDSSGTRARDTDRFTADDLVAVTFLSVRVGPVAAHSLLVSRADELAELLRETGPDRDFADEAAPLTEASPQWRLHSALRRETGIGPTIASKLMARKRPRLVPIYDSVVGAVTGTTRLQWEPLRQALRTDGRALHHRLIELRRAAGLPEAVSALRVLDVIAWREGKASGMELAAEEMSSHDASQHSV
jgi:hypothetical protein